MDTIQERVLGQFGAAKVGTQRAGLLSKRRLEAQAGGADFSAENAALS